MVEVIASYITNSISRWGYFAVLILMTLESALLPIPSEITMPFAGFMAGLGKLNFWIVVLIGALGNLIGSLLAYALGYWGGETVVRKFVKSYGKYFFVKLEEVDKSEKWFRNHGGKIAFFSRLLPVVRTYISLPAGIVKMNVIKFSIYTFAGSLLWSAFLTKTGVVLGENWSSLEIYFRRFQILIIAVILALIGFFVYHKVKKHKN